MPELPEVETIRGELASRIVGRAFVAPPLVLDPRLVQRLFVQEFTQALLGQEISGISRRGKYLLFRLSGPLTLIAHLKMTGALLLSAEPFTSVRHLRAVFFLGGGLELRFSDPRRFGAVWLVPDPAEVVGGLGPEPLEQGFTPGVLGERLRGRKAPLKAVLLDQGVLAGLGNIYADEALFRAGLAPWRAAGSLTAPETAALHGAIRATLAEALAGGGTTFSDYLRPDGSPGGFASCLQAHRREGQPCYRCGAAIARLGLRGRSAYYCPRCQGTPGGERDG